MENATGKPFTTDNSCSLAASPLAAATTRGGDLSGGELGSLGGSSADRLGLHARLYLGSHSHESLLDVIGALGRGLEELDAQRVGELLALVE